jgi:translation initiation factor IF-2
LYYPGSFSRWKFGEDGRKGWILNVYNVEDSTYANKYIENKAAPVYTTVKVELNDELSKNPEKIMDFIKDIHADKIMIKLSVVNQDSSYAIQYLISKFKNSDMVKLNISNVSDDSADVEEQEFLDELEEEYKFILDENLTLSQKLQKAVKLKKGRIIPITFIDEELDKKRT